MGLERKLAASMWRISSRLHHCRFRRIAYLVKVINYFSFRALLPPEVVIGKNLHLRYYGLGVVVHPNGSIGNFATIYHHVTIAGESWLGSTHKVIIDYDVTLGAGSKIIPRRDCGLHIGSNAVIGAGAVVTRDVPAKGIAVGVPARVHFK